MEFVSITCLVVWMPLSTYLAREPTFERPSPHLDLVAISLSPSGDEASLISEERKLNKE